MGELHRGMVELRLLRVFIFNISRREEALLTVFCWPDQARFDLLLRDTGRL